MWSDDETAAFARSHVWAAVMVNGPQLRGLGMRGDLLKRTSPAMRVQLRRHALGFAAEHVEDMALWLTPEHAAYDLWMSRTYDDIGFATRTLFDDSFEIFSDYALAVRHEQGKAAEFDAAMRRLTAGARQLDELELFVGRDGLIHV